MTKAKKLLRNDNGLYKWLKLYLAWFEHSSLQFQHNSITILPTDEIQTNMNNHINRVKIIGN